MNAYHLEELDRNSYLASITPLCDDKSFGFAKLSLKWWDRHFKWSNQGCVVLCDQEGDHLSYIFYTIDRYREYMTIHNLFTPMSLRRKGYAHELLKLVFDVAVDKNVSRFRCSCVPQSLAFYLSLGFAYWGINSVKDYYCDLPIPSDGLDGLGEMVDNAETAFLLGQNGAAIHKKVGANTHLLDKQEISTINADIEKMGTRYLEPSLEASQKEA